MSIKFTFNSITRCFLHVRLSLMRDIFSAHAPCSALMASQVENSLTSLYLSIQTALNVVMF